MRKRPGSSLIASSMTQATENHSLFLQPWSFGPVSPLAKINEIFFGHIQSFYSNELKINVRTVVSASAARRDGSFRWLRRSLGENNTVGSAVVGVTGAAGDFAGCYI